MEILPSGVGTSETGGQGGLQSFGKYPNTISIRSVITNSLHRCYANEFGLASLVWSQLWLYASSVKNKTISECGEIMPTKDFLDPPTSL